MCNVLNSAHYKQIVVSEYVDVITRDAHLGVVNISRNIFLFMDTLGKNVDSCSYYNLLELTGNKRPTLKVLNKLVKKPATYKWYDLGIELLEVEDLHALDEIHKNYPRDVGMCCTKMLQLWLERQPDASWEQLLQALKKVEMNELASTIEQEFLSVNRGKLFVICARLASWVMGSISDLPH